MDRIDRIAQMEAILGESTEAVRALSDALERYRAVLPALDKLIAYYDSALWREDYEADCQGLLPDALPRGVLSEDAVYNLILERRELEADIAAL